MRDYEIWTCYICNKLSKCNKRFGELMCNTCYHLIQRMRKKHLKDTGEEWTREEFLTRAISRRQEIEVGEKWVKEEKKENAKDRPRIRIGILR